jgi:transglutaminase-like putative cysteine protease
VSYATLRVLPDGEAGTHATLEFMASLVRQYKKTMPIRERALAVVSGVGGHKNYAGWAAALTNYVKAQIQYVPDVRDVETLQTPIATLQIGQGDCDDQATLLSALLESIGFTTRFVAVKLNPFGPYEHVVTEAQINGQWVPLETTEPWQPGYFPVRDAGKMIVEV